MQIGVEAQRAVENRRIFVVDEDDVSRPFKMEAVRRKVDRHLGRKVELGIPVVIV